MTVGERILKDRVEKAGTDKHAQLVLAESLIKEGIAIPEELRSVVIEALGNAKAKNRAKRDMYCQIAYNIRLWSLINSKSKSSVKDAIEAADRLYARSNSEDIYRGKTNYRKYKETIEQAKRDAENLYYEAGPDAWEEWKEDEM